MKILAERELFHDFDTENGLVHLAIQWLPREKFYYKATITAKSGLQLIQSREAFKSFAAAKEDAMKQLEILDRILGGIRNG